LREEVIFARIEPEQKLRIVQNLQAIKEVVAVTGDGVNDAPALVKADIGVAMGKIGTDVAKEAADMILIDDHFATIVNAVKEGRRIFDNAKRFVFYNFASNAGEFFVNVFGLLAGLPLPLLAIQVLAIDLGSDVVPSLALGVEEVDPNVMKNPPRSRTERIMNISVLYRLLYIGTIMSVFALIVFLFVLYKGGWHYKTFLSTDSPLYFRATATVYATIVLCQIINAFSAKSSLPIFKIDIFSNKWLILAEGVSLSILITMMYYKPAQTLFRTASPAIIDWGLIIFFAIMFLFLSEWWKTWVNSKSKEWFKYR